MLARASDSNRDLPRSVRNSCSRSSRDLSLRDLGGTRAAAAACGSWWHVGCVLHAAPLLPLRPRLLLLLPARCSLSLRAAAALLLVAAPAPALLLPRARPIGCCRASPCCRELCITHVAALLPHRHSILDVTRQRRALPEGMMKGDTCGRQAGASDPAVAAELQGGQLQASLEWFWSCWSARSSQLLLTLLCRRTFGCTLSPHAELRAAAAWPPQMHATPLRAARTSTAMSASMNRSPSGSPSRW